MAIPITEAPGAFWHVPSKGFVRIENLTVGDMIELNEISELNAKEVKKVKD